MILKFIKTNYKYILFTICLICTSLNYAVDANSEETFNDWLNNYKKFALKNNISQNTINNAFKNVKFLEQVIKYDRKQPEFFEDTITYVNKRANTSRSKKAKKLLGGAKICWTSDREGWRHDQKFQTHCWL